MLKRVSSALLVLALVGAFSTAALAQQEKKEPAKKEPAKTEMKKDEMAKKTEEAMGPMKSFSCGPECGFTVKSHDEKELLSMAKMHLKKHHKMEPSDKELKAQIKSEAAEPMKKD